MDTETLVESSNSSVNISKSPIRSSSPSRMRAVTVEINDFGRTEFYIEDDTEEEAIVGNNIEVTPVQTKKRTRVDAPRKNTRKRLTNSSQWKVNVSKTALNLGEAHISSKTKKERKARVMGPGCDERCNRCKARRLSIEERTKIKESFWAIGNHQRQLDYVLSCIKSATPQKKFAAPGSAGASIIRRYSFTLNGKEVRVCKTTFMDTLAICDSWIKTATKYSRAEPGSAPIDMRGKHTVNRPQRIPNLVKDNVRKHINLIPRIESHYTREQTKREYIEDGLYVEELYRRYILWSKEENLTAASESMYRKIFNEEFNIGTFKPKKDQCLLCVRWKRSTTQEKAKIARQYAIHIQNKNISRKWKKENRLRAQSGEDPKYSCSSFDLQKILMCPKSEVSAFYYVTKLSIYNFTIFDMGPKLGECYIWNETQAKKSSQEVASCVYQFIEDRNKKGIEEFDFYSDNPTSQNKNRFVFSMYLLACVKFGVKIRHRYLEVGHTHMEADSMHAAIERSVDKKEIFDQDEWCGYILNAKKNGKTRNDPVEKYVINKVNDTGPQVLDFKTLAECLNWKHDTAKKEVKVTKVREIAFDPAKPDTVEIKYDYEGEPVYVNVNQKKGRPVNLKTYRPQHAYTNLFPLPENKIKDMKDLMKNGAIPTKYHPFYNDLISIGVGDIRTGCSEGCEDCEVPEVTEENNLVPGENGPD